MNNEERILEMLAGLTETVSKLSEGQAEMRSDIADLKTTQAKQGEQLARQGEQIVEMQETLTRVAVTQEGVVLPRIQTALEGHSELKREIGTLATKEQVEELAADVDIIKEVVSRHSGDISKLKKAQ